MKERTGDAMNRLQKDGGIIKKSVVLLLILAFAMQLSVFAGTIALDDLPQFDISDNRVTISGRIIPVSEQLITLRVLEPGKTISDSYNISNIQKVDTVSANERGEFEFSFVVNIKGGSGRYPVYISGEGIDTYDTSFFVSTEGDRLAAMEEIKKINDAAVLKAALSDYSEILSLNNIIFDAVDKDGLSTFLLREIKNDSSLLSSPSTFRSKVIEVSVIEALNQNKKTLILNENNEIKDEYSAILKLMDLKNLGLSVIDYYKNDMTIAGKTVVNNELFGKSFSSITELHKLYAANIVTYGLSNSIKSGYGHVRGLLTANASYISLDLAEYNSLSDSQKNNVDIALTGANVKIVSELSSAIKNAIASLPNDSGVTTSPGGGGGGGGGFSSGNTRSEFSVSEDFVPPPDVIYAYKDLEEAEWAIEAIEALAERKIINGVGEGKFSPMTTVKREEFTKMIIGLTGLPLSEPVDNFKDSDNTMWYAEYIAAAFRSGIVFGKTDDLFGIGENILRQDAAVMISRAFPNLPDGQPREFSDSYNIDSYALEAIGRLSANKIINGTPEGNFLPRESLTRAEAAMIIYNIMMLGV